MRVADDGSLLEIAQRLLVGLLIPIVAAAVEFVVIIIYILLLLCVDYCLLALH